MYQFNFAAIADRYSEVGRSFRVSLTQKFLSYCGKIGNKVRLLPEKLPGMAGCQKWRLINFPPSGESS